MGDTTLFTGLLVYRLISYLCQDCSLGVSDRRWYLPDSGIPFLSVNRMAVVGLVEGGFGGPTKRSRTGPGGPLCAGRMRGSPFRSCIELLWAIPFSLLDR